MPTANEIKNEIIEAVERGASFLDAESPGWWDKIDLNTLRMETMESCVIGQLSGWQWQTGDNLSGLLHSPGDDGDADSDVFIEYGFDLRRGAHPHKVWVELEAEWRAVILARRGSAKQVSSTYTKMIIRATKCPPEDADEIEEIMRHEIFHSTLDWQTPTQFNRGALLAQMVLKRIKK